MITNKVLFSLVVAGLAGVLFLPFVGHAPNRLVSGQPIALAEAATTWQFLGFIALGIVLTLASFGPPRAIRSWVTLIASVPLLVLTLHTAGDYALRMAEEASPAARTSLGGAFWVLIFCAALAMIDAMQRLNARLPVRVGFSLVLVAVVAVMFRSGVFDQLSILREYANRRDTFANEFLTHVFLVLAALLPALALGVPLGIAALRRPSIRGGVFGTLNFFQTIPSIALFGLLIAPLSALGEAVPFLADIGIKGIGAAPAIIALVMYALLPIVRNTFAGFAGVSQGTIEAARGMGMTQRQILWRVEVPLALPVLLSGLRIVTVQAIGLTVVAALIGAGGLGAFIFQGLGQYALDLVLLGAIPTILLAIATDFFLQVLITLSRPEGAR